jgi:anti-sigma B factor antagonist
MSAVLNNKPGMARMDLNITEGVAFLHVRGEVDVANADQLRTLGQDAISDVVGTIRVDLSEVSFIDSTGIGALVAVRNAAEKAGRTLVLERPGPRVQKVLDITGLTAVFVIDLSAPDLR